MGFQGFHQRKLNDYHLKNIPVELTNCARHAEEFRNLLDFASLMVDVAEAVTLSSLESLDEFQRVMVNIKVLELKEETQVAGRAKRDVSVTDGSDTVRVSVWEGHINVMEKG